MLLAVEVKRIVLVEGAGRHIERGRAADEYYVVGEGFANLVVDLSALFAVGVKRELVLGLCSGAENGEGHAARGVEFNVLTCKLGKAVLLAKGGNLLRDGISVAGKHLVTHGDKLAVFVAAFLKTVVTDDIDRETAKLVPDSCALSRANHKKLVLLGKSVKNCLVLGVKGRFVLGESSVKVKCDKFDHNSPPYLLYSTINITQTPPAVNIINAH